MDRDHKDNGNGVQGEALTLDACGLFCPEPVMLLHNKIRDMKGGELLRVIATDPSTTRDIPKFCVYLGHELIEQSQADNRYFYLVRKKVDERD